MLTPGFLIGDFEIKELIGEGNFGNVYAAVHTVVEKKAAVKVLKQAAASDSEIVQRFKQEARAVNAIQHPNIVDIFDYGILADGRPYLMMEFLEGATLERWLQGRGTLPVDELLPILEPVALAIDAAHAAGVIHRDLKPENIFIAEHPTAGRRVKILDFGIAKIAQGSLAATPLDKWFGTPLYMAPEQWFGGNVNHLIDVYAFGVVAFRCLTGRFPVEGESFTQVMGSHALGQRIVASEIDASLAKYDAVFARCLDPIREHRYPTLSVAYEFLVQASVRLSTTPPPLPVEAAQTLSVPDGGDDDDDDDATIDQLDSAPTYTYAKDAPKVNLIRHWKTIAMIAGVAGMVLLAYCSNSTSEENSTDDTDYVENDRSDAVEAGLRSDAADMLARTGFDLEANMQDVVVILDGKVVDRKPPLKVRNLAPGEHSLVIEAPPGFLDINTILSIDAGTIQLVEARLEPMEVTGAFESTPRDAEVILIVDDAHEKVIGRTPVKYRLDRTSKYKAQFTKTGYIPEVVEVPFSGETEERIAVALTPRKKPLRKKPLRKKPLRKKPLGKPGTLMLGSKPPARILIDGKDTGKKTPQRDLSLPPGRHRIILVNDEHGFRYSFICEIKSGQVVKKTFDLTDTIE